MIVCRDRILRLHNFTSKQLVSRRKGDDLKTRSLPRQARVDRFVKDEGTPPGGCIVFVVVSDEDSRYYSKGESFHLPVRQAIDYYGQKRAAGPA